MVRHCMCVASRIVGCIVHRFVSYLGVCDLMRLQAKATTAVRRALNDLNTQVGIVHTLDVLFAKSDPPRPRILHCCIVDGVVDAKMASESLVKQAAGMNISVVLPSIWHRSTHSLSEVPARPTLVDRSAVCTLVGQILVRGFCCY
jgi:hypothetical protein